MKVLEGSAPDVSAAPVRRDFLSRLSDVLGATDLPLNCHPAAIRAVAVSVTP